MSQDLKGRAAGAVKASFGFARVGEEAKQGLVNEVFAKVAPRYDLMNDLMSGGLHRLWKDDLVSWLAPPKSAAPFVIVDVAGGTGDVALRALKAGGPGASATICDISAEMIEAGRGRAGDARLGFVRGNAESLPFTKSSFDAYTIAFGMRNLTHLGAALAEAFRVLKPGGRLMVLEFSHVPEPALRWLYDRYSFNIIPPLGQALAGDRASYRYLVESIRRFPDQETLAGMMHTAGLEDCRYHNLSGGIVALHKGFRY
jgi:demethylmenaquinone methyltransferase/2-methoxy-6-polyprenyl-1,4-benzoquinol methylase